MAQTGPRARSRSAEEPSWPRPAAQTDERTTGTPAHDGGPRRASAWISRADLDESSGRRFDPTHVWRALSSGALQLETRALWARVCSMKAAPLTQNFRETPDHLGWLAHSSQPGGQGLPGAQSGKRIHLEQLASLCLRPQSRRGDLESAQTARTQKCLLSRSRRVDTGAHMGERASALSARGHSGLLRSRRLPAVGLHPGLVTAHVLASRSG